MYLKSFAKEWQIGDFSRVVCEFDGQEHEVKENKLKIYVLDIYFVFISFRLKYWSNILAIPKFIVSKFWAMDTKK